MNLTKHLLSVTVWAVCQMALAQPTGTPASPPSAARADEADSDAAQASARILRGDDQLIAPAKPTAALAGPPISLSFEEAPVAEVVRTILGDLLRVDYVLYQPINGTITLSTRAPVSPDQAVFLLESALFANGLALTRDARGSYHVGRPEALKGVSGGVRQAVNGQPLAPGSGAIVVPLQFIGAAEMATILRPLLPQDSLIRVDSLRNLLVLVGTRTQAEGWLELVNTFDVNVLRGMSVGVFPLKYVTAQEVESALQLLSGAASASATTGGAKAPTSTNAATSAGSPVNTTPLGAATTSTSGARESLPLFGAVRVMPIERINSILVVTPRAAYLEEARRWIERFDRPNDNSGEAQLHIYRVQNGNARHLAGVLQGIFGGNSNNASATTGVAPGLASSTSTTTGNALGSTSLLGNQNGGLGLRSGGMQAGTNRNTTAAYSQQPVSTQIGNIRVMSDDLNNSVLVWGTKTEYRKIESTLKRLDLPPTQVLIEASIIEVTLNDNLQYGLQWAFSDSRNTTNYTGLGMLSSSQESGKFSAPSSGFSYTLKNSLGTVRAILTALSAKTSVKVVASPSLMVLDNHQAAISVGSQIPVQTATTTFSQENAATTSSYQWKDTGVSLTVTPSVNSGNLVSMQIDQSVTDVGAADEVTKQRAFLQRQLSSKVAVRSGESIVMGGLIQERDTNSKSGIPVLHTVPVVGNLFGTTGNEGSRTELLVIITPRVVRSDIDVREVSDDLRERLQGLVHMDLVQKNKSALPSNSIVNKSTTNNNTTNNINNIISPQPFSTELTAPQ